MTVRSSYDKACNSFHSQVPEITEENFRKRKQDQDRKKLPEIQKYMAIIQAFMDLSTYHSKTLITVQKNGMSQMEPNG